MRPHAVVVAMLLLSSSAFALEMESAREEDAIAERWTDLRLTRQADAPFRRLMEMAQSGRLGDEVDNANIGVWKNHARVELIRRDKRNSVYLLVPKGRPVRVAPRYFDIEPQHNDHPEDRERLAAALDEAFSRNPFELTELFFLATPGRDPSPNLTTALAEGRWRDIPQLMQRKVASAGGLAYALTVVAGCLGILVLQLSVLWRSRPILN